jgi:ferredoxin--NADP+ reductase
MSEVATTELDTGSEPLRVAVIGAGPAGFYTVEALLKSGRPVQVDLFDRLPTPYGLVRFGVAPDHQKIKSVTRLYERTLQDERVRYFGNVEYGRDLDLADLQSLYQAVVFTVGSPTDRPLGIPGEHLPGSLSATEFVAWYNGHPDFAGLEVPLDARDVVVIGMGNVAVDVTRVLAKSVTELATTDMADHALAALGGSAVRSVVMVGRRGPAEAKFTTKELRELGELENADIRVSAAEVAADEASIAAAAGDLTITKNLEVLAWFAEQSPSGKPRSVELRFLLSPVEFVGTERVEAVRFERNRLEPNHWGGLSAVGTGEFEEIPAQLVLRSVGYRGAALPGVPFDERAGVIPNDEGRVLGAPGGEPVPGIYVAGWIKRGPSGVIGTNKACAIGTVASLLADSLPPLPAAALGEPDVEDLLRERGVRYLDTKTWLRLDAAELAAGTDAGRPRVKRVTIEEMFELER